MLVSYKTAQQVGKATVEAGAEEEEATKLSVDIVEAEMMGRDVGLPGRSQVVPFTCERTCLASSIEEPRSKITGIERWI